MLYSNTFLQLFQVYCVVSGTLAGCFFGVYFYKDCIGTDAFDTFERNYIFNISSKYAADAPRSRNNKGFDTSAAYIKFNITHSAKNFTVTGINDIFISKLA